MTTASRYGPDMKLRLPSSSAWIVQRLIHATALWTRPMTLGVRAIVIDEQDRILLVQHSYVPGWHLPGGAVEPGETTLDAVRRETREECGIEIRGHPLLHGVFFNAAASRRDHVVVYVVRCFGPTKRPISGWEIVGTGFFAASDLPPGTTRSTRARIREALEGTQPLAEW